MYYSSTRRSKKARQALTEKFKKGCSGSVYISLMSSKLKNGKYDYITSLQKSVVRGLELDIASKTSNPDDPVVGTKPVINTYLAGGVSLSGVWMGDPGYYVRIRYPEGDKTPVDDKNELLRHVETRVRDFLDTTGWAEAEVKSYEFV